MSQCTATEIRASYRSVYKEDVVKNGHSGATVQEFINGHSTDDAFLVYITVTMRLFANQRVTQALVKSILGDRIGRNKLRKAFYELRELGYARSYPCPNPAKPEPKGWLSQ